MQHKFTRVAILLGHRFSTEYCENCGCESQRYKSGSRRWIVDGKIVDTAPECIGIDIKDAQLKYNLPVPVESIMEDATVIIKLLYDDWMQIHGFDGTRSMRIAKTFLESKQLL